MRKDKTVLYLDDNVDHRELLKFLFEDAGYKILTCSSVSECLDYLQKNEISVLVMDYRLAGEEMSVIGERIKRLYPHLPFFFFTGDAQSKSRERGIRSGAQGYLLKPDDINHIVPTIDKFISNQVSLAA